MSEVRKYWLTATHGATIAKDWFTVAEDESTAKLFGGDLDCQAELDAAFQVMRLTGSDDSMVANAFRRGEIVLTTDDGDELAMMPAKSFDKSSGIWS